MPVPILMLQAHLNSETSIFETPETAVCTAGGCFFFVDYLRGMYVILITLLALLFLALLVLNVYFRVRVLKAYKTLVQNRVEFSLGQVLNEKRMHDEVLAKYPQQREAILEFVRNMKRSIRMATILVVCITLIGAVMMYYR